MANVTLRYCTEYELRNVLRIERLCFTEPWGRREFMPFIDRGKVLIAECDSTLDMVGYAAYECSRGELRLVNLAVEPANQRRGIGRALVERLKNKLSPDRRQQMTALVPEWNLPAHLFLRSCGFIATAEPTGYLFRFDVADAPAPRLHLFNPGKVR